MILFPLTPATAIEAAPVALCLLLAVSPSTLHAQAGIDYEDSPADSKRNADPIEVDDPRFQVPENVCRFDPDKGPEMVVIPPGSFRMGSNEKGGNANEQPAHDVTIDYAFALGRCEVTYAEFAYFVESAPDVIAQVGADDCLIWDTALSKFIRRIASSWQDPQLPIDEDLANYPVVCVNVPMVEAYIRWLNERTGLQYRLPSEAEFEYALRGGGADSSQWLEADDQCRFANMADRLYVSEFSLASNADSAAGCDDGFSTLSPAGSFIANPYGLHDLYGNVWEWVADCWHSSYEDAPSDGSAWSENCTENNSQVLRGGSWDFGPEYLNSTDRSMVNVDNAVISVGFRLARTLP